MALQPNKPRNSYASAPAAAIAGLFVSLTMTGSAQAQFGLPSCPGQWVSGGGGMMCLCPDGSYANGYPAVCPTARRYNAPRPYVPPAPSARDIEAARQAEAERVAREKALAEEAKRKHEADIKQAQDMRQDEVSRRKDALRKARERDVAMHPGQTRPTLNTSGKVSSSLLGDMKATPTHAGGGQSGWATPTTLSQQQVQANNRHFESIMNDPSQPVVSRRLAAAVLGKPLPDLAGAGAAQIPPQVSQAQRELAAIAYGKQPLPAATTTKILSMKEQLRATMNNPRESVAMRSIAAIGLGIDPKTLGLATGAQAPAAAPVALGKPVTIEGPVAIGAPAGQPALAPPAQASSVPPQRLNPNLSTDIVTLSPPPQAAPSTAAPVQNQYMSAPSTFAPPPNSQNASALDSKTAKQALPYALLSRDVYSDTGGKIAAASEWKRAANWDKILQDNGASPGTIETIRKSGFFAAVYRNQKSGEISIVFRGTDSLKDVVTSAGANAGFLPIQYAAASSLTTVVKASAGPNQTITLAGHSLGGALASYAANDNGLKKVVTFNAARGYLSDGVVNSPSQINIYTKGEIIGDPSKSSAFGTGRLSGQAIGADSKVENGNLIKDFDVHSIKNVIDTLSDAASAN